MENSQHTSQNWFESWFDSPYYHILYQHRNNQEAQLLIDNLTEYLNLPENATVLDLACGKGRHALYLNSLGYRVTGVDLSENNITYAQQFANDTLQFAVHDMREPLGVTFDAVFNLFTSFGYFENNQDNYKTIAAIKDSINEYGFAVLDFMNVPYVLNHLIAHEIKSINNIDFHISRYEKEGYIYKEIKFEDQGKSYHFTEKVQALTLNDFTQMIEQNGMYLLDIFGNYKLQKYHTTESERLIMIFK
ncbi:SAM-dependent methyltransferase [Flavobacterium croceum]|uniref:Methyltransferase family protein n=1 Tax=Flavobacterium croceum DSM 17960 TaxID=1121886 RepID=A0A2S4NB87_9FLAO|nr:class I SAM-dependent methyltransferase [Flavobacterium croceum]POS02890.1 methyltransferase family protein [Flavobacterium croceum DSM 17960]